MSPENKPFFVGYLGIPKGLGVFLGFISIMLLTAFATSAALIGGTQDDPGKAGFRFDYGRQTLEGVIEANPYPVLHVTKGNKRIKAGRTLMLSGQGKSGAMKSVAALEGNLVETTGIILERGELDMLQLFSGKRGIKLLSHEIDIPKSKPIGTWRVQGEICDGKCLAGAMNPGRGLAHKACANLCLEGEIPPVFVSSQPVEGQEFMLIGNADGGPFGKELYDYVGHFVDIEAKIEKRGDVLVLLVDLNKVRLIP